MTFASILRLAIAFALGYGVALLVARIRSRTSSPSGQEMKLIPPPLSEEDFEKRMEANDKRYHEAMAQYDKLVPWAAGGALVVSLSFVSSFSPVAASWTKLILASAWVALSFALLSSILSQYSSTRIQVWAKNYLQSRQNPPVASADVSVISEWNRQTLEFERRSRRRGRNTKLLNVVAGVSLVIGLLTLGAFAILAVPFGTEAIR